MITLQNNFLSIQVLNPAADARHLGSRYCTGGYIFQIHDAQGRTLLSGPTFPDGQYNGFDGQGAPEVFVDAPGADTARIGEDVLVMGVGTVKRISEKSPFHVRDNPTVTQFCVWDTKNFDDSIIMKTRQQFKNWDFNLTRAVILNGKTIVSKSTIENYGDTLPVFWFAHPFFPVPENHQICRFLLPFSLGENEGYTIDNEYITMKKTYDWSRGLYKKLQINQHDRLSVYYNHPRVKPMKIECDFPLDSLAIWANNRTFSFEPFFKKCLKKGEDCSWEMRYLF